MGRAHCNAVEKRGNSKPASAAHDGMFSKSNNRKFVIDVCAGALIPTPRHHSHQLTHVLSFSSSVCRRNAMELRCVSCHTDRLRAAFVQLIAVSFIRHTASGVLMLTHFHRDRSVAHVCRYSGKTITNNFNVLNVLAHSVCCCRR